MDKTLNSGNDMARLPGKEAIYRVADAFRKRALQQGRALLWPAIETWDVESCKAVSEAILKNLDEGAGTFMQKLEVQLQGKREASHRIAADVLAFYYLFPSTIGADTKASRLREALRWQKQTEPQGAKEVEDAFAEGGIGGAGIYYNMGQPWQFTFYLRFAEEALRSGGNLDDPNAVKSIAQKVEDEADFMSGAGPNILLHLFFPDDFERIASNQHKKQIVAALGDGHAADVDDALRSIRAQLESRFGRQIDFYDDPQVRELWDSDRLPPPPRTNNHIWIEKTLVKGRPDRLEGEYAVGRMLWSPQARKDGANIYGAMRDVRQGDVVLHLTDDEAFTGMSRASGETEDLVGLADTPWAGRPCWQIKLEGYQALVPPLSRRVLFATPWKERLVGLLDAGVANTFFTREPNLNQGKYLTPAPDSLVAVLNEAYEATTGRTLPISGLLLSPPPPPPPPNLDLASCVTDFSEAIRKAHLDLGPDHFAIVRAIMASLVTKRFLILTGLSGSGKSQIALKLGQWFGSGRFKLVPVRPDWTGPDALFGYEDALKATSNGRRAWQVPEPLAFMLRAAADPLNPYLLALDEMNLAHVERYFADALSGMESREPCLPRLTRDPEDGVWRDQGSQSTLIPIPRNLFVVGTVNVDETTYLFSPKVLDRANTFEFRVQTAALKHVPRLPSPIAPGPEALVRGFALLSQDDGWHEQHAPAWADSFSTHLSNVHALLSEASLEFGHRIYYEASRFAAFYAATGPASPQEVLDRVIMQKILPRIHGSRKRVEVPLCALATFCQTLSHVPGTAKPGANLTFNLDEAHATPALPQSLDKVTRMLRTLRANQFTSFTD